MTFKKIKDTFSINYYSTYAFYQIEDKHYCNGFQTFQCCNTPHPPFWVLMLPGALQYNALLGSHRGCFWVAPGSQPFKLSSAGLRMTGKCFHKIKIASMGHSRACQGQYSRLQAWCDMEAAARVSQ